MLSDFYSKEKWDGDSLPNFIKNLLDLSNGKLYLGGGSLIKHRFFSDEEWGMQDYDFWAEKDVNDVVYNYIKDSNLLIQDEHLNDIYFENYSGVKYIEKVHTIVTEEFTIQLIDVKKYSYISKIMKSVDLTFTGCLYNGKEIYYGINPEEIKNKKGDIIIHDNYGNNYYPHCYIVSSKFKKLKERVDKYLKRGFQFNNLCPWCYQAINPTVAHLKECLLYTHLGSKAVINKNVEEIYQLIMEDKNSELIIAFLSALIDNRDITNFNKYFDKIKPSELCIDNNYLLVSATKLGLYSVIKKIYEFNNQNNTLKINIEVPDHTLIKIAVKNNFQNIAKYYCEINPKYHLEIFEDAIIKFKIKSIFETYLEKNEKSRLFRLFPMASKLLKDETCGICKYTKSDIKLECGHNFCDICLITWFQNNKNCPYCQKNIMYNETF